MKGEKARKQPSRGSSAAASAQDPVKETQPQRKKTKGMGLEQQAKMLEEENLSLRLQLKVGKETVKQDEQKKEDLLNRIAHLVANNHGSDDELKGQLKSYVVRYSDCSSDHAESVDNHMVQIQRLLAPTKVTKLCLWALNQEEEFFKPVLSPQESLFQVMCDAIETTLDQTEEFKNYRHNARVLTRGLRFTDRECDDLRQRLKRKNRAIAEEMHELQDILTPKQLGKFIIWANRDKDLQQVLKSEWVGWSDPQEEEAKRETQQRKQRERIPSHSADDDDEEDYQDDDE